jgi:hypothetical protein
MHVEVDNCNYPGCNDKGTRCFECASKYTLEDDQHRIMRACKKHKECGSGVLHRCCMTGIITSIHY